TFPRVCPRCGCGRLLQSPRLADLGLLELPTLTGMEMPSGLQLEQTLHGRRPPTWTRATWAPCWSGRWFQNAGCPPNAPARPSGGCRAAMVGAPCRSRPQRLEAAAVATEPLLLAEAHDVDMLVQERGRDAESKAGLPAGGPDGRLLGLGLDVPRTAPE
ncbi:unnamed protein product, partial [Prorocentrum cordatum]